MPDGPLLCQMRLGVSAGRGKQRDKGGEKEGKGYLCFIFFILNGAEASRSGLLPTSVLYVLKLDLGAGCQHLACSGGHPPRWCFPSVCTVFTVCSLCGRRVISAVLRFSSGQLGLRHRCRNDSPLNVAQCSDHAEEIHAVSDSFVELAVLSPASISDRCCLAGIACCCLLCGISCRTGLAEEWDHLFCLVYQTPVMAHSWKLHMPRMLSSLGGDPVIFGSWAVLCQACWGQQLSRTDRRTLKAETAFTKGNSTYDLILAAGTTLRFLAVHHSSLSVLRPSSPVPAAQVPALIISACLLLLMMGLRYLSSS